MGQRCLWRMRLGHVLEQQPCALPVLRPPWHKVCVLLGVSLALVLAHPLQVREAAPTGVHQLWLRLELREDRAPGREDLVPGLCGLGAAMSTGGCTMLLPHTIPSGPSVVSGGRKCRSTQKLALSIKHSSVLTACSSSGLLRRGGRARIEHVPVAVTAPGVRGQRVPGELLLQVRPRGSSEQGRGHSEQGGIIPWLTNTRTGGGGGQRREVCGPRSWAHSSSGVLARKGARRARTLVF